MTLLVCELPLPLLCLMRPATRVLEGTHGERRDPLFLHLRTANLRFQPAWRPVRGVRREEALRKLIARRCARLQARRTRYFWRTEAMLSEEY